LAASWASFSNQRQIIFFGFILVRTNCQMRRNFFGQLWYQQDLKTLIGQPPAVLSSVVIRSVVFLPISLEATSEPRGFPAHNLSFFEFNPRNPVHALSSGV